MLRFVQSTEEQKKILQACHIDPTTGHMGKTRTIYRIKERFMWHGMVKDVIKLVCTVESVVLWLLFDGIHFAQISTCDVCQHMNRKITTGTPELHPIPVKSPWHQIGIDFVGPLSPVAADGSCYIFTASDYFTKWVEAVPTTDKSASTVASVLFKVRTNCTQQGMNTLYMHVEFQFSAVVFAPLHYRYSCGWVYLK